MSALFRRVAALVESLDVGEPYKLPQNCGEGAK